MEMFTPAFLMNVLPVANGPTRRATEEEVEKEGEEEEESSFVVLPCLEACRRVAYSCSKCCD